jgi:hypothetical protein
VKDFFQRTRPCPLLNAAMARLVGRIALGQILSRSSGAEHPEDPMQHVSCGLPGASPAIGSPRRRNQGLENSPLSIGQIQWVLWPDSGLFYG